MAIYRTANFVVRPAMLTLCKKAVAAFVSYVRRNEPRTRMYVCLQDREEPTRFVMIMVFEDQASERRHRISPAFKRLNDILAPNTVDGIRFADCDPIGPGVPAVKKNETATSSSTAKMDDSASAVADS